MNRYSEAAEMMLESLRITFYATRNPVLRKRVHPNEVRMWQDDVIMLTHASPFYWNAKCVQMVNALSKDISLKDILCTRELWPVDFAYHYFEKEPFMMQIADPDAGARAGAFIPVKAISWGYALSAQGVPMIGITAWTTDPLASRNRTIPASSLWLSVAEGEPMDSYMQRKIDSGPDVPQTHTELDTLARFVCCAAIFLRQKLLRTEQAAVERHARKRMQSAGADKLAERKVQVVYMRSYAAKQNESIESASAEHERAVREYDFRWSVRGHIRQQWYPSIEKHLPLYIHPHLKGPEDKPVRPRTTPLIAVTR